MDKDNKIKQTIYGILQRVCKGNAEKIDEKSSIYRKCGMDSIQFVHFMLLIEKKFEITLSDELQNNISEASIDDFVKEINSKGKKNEGKQIKSNC